MRKISGNRILCDAYAMIFWKDGVAGEPLDHNKVVVHVKPNGPSFEFESSQSIECAKLCGALESAFETGRLAKAEEIRKVLIIS